MTPFLKYVTIATVNTHFGQLLRAHEGLVPIAGADILLLQEVINPEVHSLETYLEPAGFSAVYIEPKFGLVIAFRQAAGLRIGDVAGSRTLQKMSILERFIIQRSLGRKIAYGEHGCVVLDVVTKAGKKLTVVNTHLTVPPQPLARAMQVRRLGRVLEELGDGHPLVVAGDMNHYPRPWSVDELMRTRLGLDRINIGSEPTWRAQSVRKTSLLRVVARLSRRPLEAFDGQHDAMLYKGGGLELDTVEVVDVESDHRAIVARFSLAP